jgi:hypothetical protein
MAVVEEAARIEDMPDAVPYPRLGEKILWIFSRRVPVIHKTPCVSDELTQARIFLCLEMPIVSGRTCPNSHNLIR